MIIDNEIDSDPKLRVVGVVIIQPGLFVDRSNSLVNMTVNATRAGGLVEQHNCTYSATVCEKGTVLGGILCCGTYPGNVTKFRFENSKNIPFSTFILILHQSLTNLIY